MAETKQIPNDTQEPATVTWARLAGFSLCIAPLMGAIAGGGYEMVAENRPYAAVSIIVINIIGLCTNFFVSMPFRPEKIKQSLLKPATVAAVCLAGSVAAHFVTKPYDDLDRAARAKAEAIWQAEANACTAQKGQIANPTTSDQGQLCIRSNGTWIPLKQLATARP